MSEVVHAVLTDYGEFGWGVTSPQLPELVGGRASLQDLEHDLHDVLTFAGWDGVTPVRKHRQRYLVIGGQECMIRMAVDDVFAERVKLGDRLASTLRGEDGREIMQTVQPTPTGELSFICSVRIDTLSSVIEQLDPRGDSVAAACLVGSDRVWLAQLAAGTSGPSSWPSLDRIGLRADATIGDLMEYADKHDNQGVLV